VAHPDLPDVGAWLRSLGLEQYEAAFRDNAIDATVLASLTAEDLKDVGVVLVGHRRKLLDAIAALASDAKATAPPPAVSSSVDRPASDSAERRQITVMFSDLVGWTALSARMDPEDLREIIAAYHKCVADIVGRFGGFVAQYLGDGALVYFGYPHAQEDDAERAVRTALALSAAVGGLTTRVPLRARVGIATGMVVVGDLIGSEHSQERGIVGETPNLAARLQGIAEPNMVVIAENTRRLVGNLFDLEDLGAREFKGIAGQVRAWAALRASSAQGRFEAMHASGLTALVGREEESELLLRRWSKAKTGEGQVVLLSGEGGIGKSRLAAALLERLSGEPHTRLRYFCSPQRSDSAFYPIIGQVERAAGLAHDDTPQAKLDKLDALLAYTSTSKQDAALIAELLSLPNDGRYATLDLNPEERRKRTLEALSAQTDALQRQNPVLLILEDAHWADPTSLEVFGRAVDRIAALRVLLIVTFRPEFVSPWIGLPHVTALTINRLAERDAGAIIDRVVGNKLIPAGIRQDIIERTDGIPLFVEEMTKAILEAEGEREAERAAAAVPSPALAVPASLHASLMARLDRLGAAKEVAQIGAAIGREFSHALLAAVVRQPEAELTSALHGLVAAGLLSRHGVPPHASYLFKHALVQDTAYGMLLRDHRRSLHARIADVLESQFAEIAERQPELLARHYTEAGLIESAAGLWGKAGQRSLEHSALAEATEQLTRAVDQIATLPSTQALRREHIKLQVALINALGQLKGYVAPETRVATERARLLIEQAEALGEPPEDPLVLFSVLYGFFTARMTALGGNSRRDAAALFLALAEKQKATTPLMVGHRLMGFSTLIAGDLVEARAHFDRALALYDPAEHRPLAMRFGYDSEVYVLTYRARALWLLGYPEAALRDADHALKNAREMGQAFALTIALVNVAITQMLCGNYSAATARAAEHVALTQEKGALFWRARGSAVHGCVLAVTGKASDAVDILTAEVGGYRSTGAPPIATFHLSFLARAHMQVGQFADASRWTSEAMRVIETTKDAWWEAEIHRTAGEIALLSPEPDAAKTQGYFERALAVARAQQAKSLELRAAMSLARLWRDQGKREEARALLAPVYGRFTEGFDTLDLKEAKGLLDALV
jgi:class 3 adenylate cyclase/predicted ATPase